MGSGNREHTPQQEAAIAPLASPSSPVVVSSVRHVYVESRRPRLYIDVDGVLFGFYDGYFQLRPNAIGFLLFCVQNFTCYWLTAWSELALNELLRRTYGGNIIGQISYCMWTTNKAPAIDMTGGHQWWWVEDDLTFADASYLDRLGQLNRHIYVDPQGADNLYAVIKTLQTKLLEQ